MPDYYITYKPEIMYTKSDLKQFKRRGIKPEQIDSQLENFKNGFNFVQIRDAATIGNGIHSLNDEQADEFIRIFEEKRNTLKIMKMVPASGSASRMFKTLNSFLNTYTGSDEDYLNFRLHKEPGSIFSFFEKLKEFPFYTHLKEALYKDRFDLDKLLWKNELITILEYILTDKGLNYNSTPKGLIDFHIYKDHIRTAVEEHLVEAALYANDGKMAHIHFTVSEEHMGKFKALLKHVLKDYQKKFNLKYDITFSIQSPSTDTVSLDSKGDLLRDNDGNIVFRPGGHGALIHNLNDLKEDLIFIKNIDNVTPDRNKADTVKYKKILAGVLLKTQARIFDYMKILNKKSSITEENLNEIEQFIYDNLGYKPKEDLVHPNLKERAKYLKNLLDRPLRVCGMVKNEGESGGGPFWVEDAEHGKRLMIVESAQVNQKDKNQKKIFTQSTHFNPVDIVCCTYNYKGKKYDLKDFIDNKQGFITNKSFEGKDIQVQELPGLWNGAMANWNTVFVEVPLSTFTPVKTVFDLLRFEHRNVFKIE